MQKYRGCSPWKCLCLHLPNAPTQSTVHSSKVRQNANISETPSVWGSWKTKICSPKWLTIHTEFLALWLDAPNEHHPTGPVALSKMARQKHLWPAVVFRISRMRSSLLCLAPTTLLKEGRSLKEEPHTAEAWLSNHPSVTSIPQKSYELTIKHYKTYIKIIKASKSIVRAYYGILRVI